MIETIPHSEREGRLAAAALPAHEARAFLAACAALERSPADANGGWQAAAAPVADLCRQGRALLGRLPLRSKRSAEEKAAGQALVHLMASAAWRFHRAHCRAVYDQVTAGRTRALRVDGLLWAAAEALPGIVPSREELQRERQRLQMDKDGLEIHQGLFLSQVLSDEQAGRHLIWAMQRPTAEALERLPEFQRTGRMDLGKVLLEARGEAGYLHFHNPRSLNSSDEDCVGPQELACDLILLHPGLRMGVLRGGRVDHPRYAGRRIFSAGINLTRIYQGQQAFLMFPQRELGFVHKMFRGLTGPEHVPGEPEQTLEKPWLAVLETFAIGGGCQLLLVMDYVIAESGAFFSLPARKEGIIPGCANLRLPRFMGENRARHAILFDKQYYVDAPEGRALINEVVPRERIEQAVQDCVANAVGSGMVSAGGNRKAIRVQTEPLDVFRAYMATYAYEQAFCHLSEQLIQNLEKNWNAQQRKL